MQSKVALDRIAGSFIEAARRGYEWSAVKIEEGRYEHFFYNPSDKCYDAALKSMIEETEVNKKDVLYYCVSHPVKTAVYVSSIWKMRKRALDKLYEPQ